MNQDKFNECQKSLNLMLTEANNLKENLPDFRSKFETIIKLLDDVNYCQFDIKSK
jgi:hypothetical protein